MQLKNLFLSIPRTTLQTLVKYRIFRPNILVWYDLIRFFDTIDFSEEAQQRRMSKFRQPFGQMDRYALTADRFHLSEDQTRHIVARLNTPLARNEIPPDNTRYPRLSTRKHKINLHI